MREGRKEKEGRKVFRSDRRGQREQLGWWLSHSPGKALPGTILQDIAGAKIEAFEGSPSFYSPLSLPPPSTKTHLFLSDF